MPSTTERQARTMAAAAHDPSFAHRIGIPVKVAQDFNRADTGSAMLSRAMHHEHHRIGGGVGLGSQHPTSTITPIKIPDFAEHGGIGAQHSRGFADGGGIGRTHLQGGGMSPWYERQEAREITGNEINHGGGLLNSSIAGRTDRLPVAVAADSHVIPAAEMSGLGQGNTQAGARIISEALKIGPYGTQEPAMVHGSGPPPHHPPPVPGQVMHEMEGGLAEGGSTAPHKIAHCLMAGGEFVIPAEDWHDGESWYRGVRSTGEGDIEKGHKRLRDMTMRIRAHTIKTLKELPGPKK